MKFKCQRCGFESEESIDFIASANLKKELCNDCVDQLEMGVKFWNQLM